MENKEKKKKIKSIARIFIAIYLLSFFIINWNDVSWIFNYKAVYGLMDDFFTPYQNAQASLASSNFYLNRPSGNNLKASEIVKAKFTYSEKNNILEIPKIGISVPIIFSQNTEQKSLLEDLNKGVVYYPGSVLPEESGQSVILGHSAPPNWPKIKQDTVFSELDNLSPGDKIIVYINNKRYTYTVKRTDILEKGQEIVSEDNSLALVSCYPPGKDLQRITVQAEIDSF